MKATITIVAMALTALAVAPQRGFAQYGYGPYGAYPGPMGPAAAPYAVQPAYYPSMGPAAFAGQPPGLGYYPGAAMAYQPELPPAPPGMGGAGPAPNGAYPPSPGGYGPTPPYYGPGGPANTGYGGYPSEYDGAISGDNCGACADGCGWCTGLAPVFFGAEWLLWVRHGQQVPPLVTTSPAGVDPANAGVIGQGAIVTFGGGRLDDGFQPGVRLTGGLWLDPMHEVGIGGRIFALGTDKTDYAASSPTGQPIIARPYINNANPNNPVEAAFVVAYSDGNPNNDPRTGSLQAEVTSDLWGGDITTSVMLTQGIGYRIDMLAGYQFYRIDEAVAIRSSSVQGTDFFNDNIPNGTILAPEDIFDTQNEFHGGALGMVAELQQGAFSFKAMGRVAVGNMNEKVRLFGSTTITPPPPAMGAPFPPVTIPGGVLVPASSIGQGERDRTAIVPECDLTFGYNFTPNLTFTMGYSFIYWTHVAPAGPQINRAVDPTAPPPAVPPTIVVRDTDFWVMGLNGGFEWRY